MNDPDARPDVPSVYQGFSFHMLRHTAASLMALAGLTPAAAAERLEQADGGAFYHRTYRHLYEEEKRTNASLLQELIEQELDENGTEDGEGDPEGRNQADSEDGRYWPRTWLQNGHLKYIGCALGWAPADHACTKPSRTLSTSSERSDSKPPGYELCSDP
jgi:hypothetical protein